MGIPHFSTDDAAPARRISSDFGWSLFPLPSCLFCLILLLQQQREPQILATFLSLAYFCLLFSFPFALGLGFGIPILFSL